MPTESDRIGATLLQLAANEAVQYLESLKDRAFPNAADRSRAAAKLWRPVPEEGTPHDQVLREFIANVDEVLLPSGGPRFFGFVMGGATPCAIAADWLTAAWDQNAQAFECSPAAAVVEETVAAWMLDMLHLPESSSVGFATGGQMANFTALSVARNTVLSRHGWDIEGRGLFGAPEIRVFTSEQCHSSVRNALHMVGIGTNSISYIPADQEGRMLVHHFETQISSHTGPGIVSVQAGNVNTGSFEPIGEIARIAGSRGAWIHVDGAFGLWAALSARRSHLLRGLDLADSCSVDCHKWLNVPYDSGLVIFKDRAAHRGLKVRTCGYAAPSESEGRNGSTWVPENSRRARAFVLYVALRVLGKSGIRALIDASCRSAELFAEGLAGVPFARALNEIVLNQVLIAVEPPECRDLDGLHRRIATLIQEEGSCWIGTTDWCSRVILRASFCCWQTDDTAVLHAIDSLRMAVVKAADIAADA